VGKYRTAGQVTDDNMAHEHFCWITKARDRHLEYAILIAFLLQKWALERALMLGLCVRKSRSISL
jgi:hypothetical protein